VLSSSVLIGGNDIASEMGEAISFPPIETGYESTPNEQLYTHSTKCR